MISMRRLISTYILGQFPKKCSKQSSVVTWYTVTSSQLSTDSKKSVTSTPAGSVGKGHANHLVGQDFLSLKHFSTDDIKQFLWTAQDLKTRMKDNREVFQPLQGKMAALIFQKRSTRTRLSAELGVAKLGGHACFLGPDDIHLGVNESVKDSARVLAGMADIILARVYGQNILDELAVESKVPVVSGLSDLLHPLQILADLLTLQEHFGYLKGLKIAWIGDGNNILHSLMYGCAKIGIDLNAATPTNYEPDSDITAEAFKLAETTGATFQLGNDPVKAAYRADVVVTDTWVSMGQEEEKKKRLKDFAGYQINREMLKEANKDWVFLHCLPRKQEEVTDDIFYSKNSLVWQEAENRMWTVMAVILHLLQPYKPTIPIPKFDKK
uniref:ornithine carbamoyltransferase n=1 Tax=Arion vulgaris TaxID=1028688 RepID=A0A0B7A1T4_9EUPU